MKLKTKLLSLVMALCMALTIVAPLNAQAATKTPLSKATVAQIARQTYTGNAITPKVTVKVGKTTLKLNTDYTVKYAKNVNVGLAKVTITGKGKYTGSKTVSFRINPKGTKITNIEPIVGGFKVKWTKLNTKMKTTFISGYQIQYATNSSFTQNEGLATINGYKNSLRTISDLQEKTTYYVRIRSCKLINGTYFYSKWSATETVKTKGEVLPKILYGTTIKTAEYTSDGTKFKVEWNPTLDKTYSGYILYYFDGKQHYTEYYDTKETSTTILGVQDTKYIQVKIATVYLTNEGKELKSDWSRTISIKNPNYYQK